MNRNLKALIRRACACVLGLAGGFTMVSAAQAQSIELCLALDSSGSIVSTDWELQIDAYRAALSNKEVVPQDGSVAISIVAFSSKAELVLSRTTVTAATAQNPGGAIETALRDWYEKQMKGETAIGSAIELCTSTFSGSTTARKVIDVSTDGRHNLPETTDPIVAANNAIAAGVRVINLLGVGGAINADELNAIARPAPGKKLGEGDGFVTTVAEWKDFRTSLEAKIKAELKPPALTVSKDNGVSTLMPGATTTYTVTIVNNGEAAATDVRWDDTFVGLNVTGITTDTASPGSVLGNCTAAGCTGITVAGNGGSVSYKVDAKVTGTAGSDAENTATVTGGGCDDGQAFCRATDKDPIQAPLTPAELTVTKNNGVGSLVNGATTTYTVTITNKGQMAAENVSWSDTFVGLNVTGITHYTASAGSALGTCTTNGCENITVAGGGSVSYRVRATVTGEVGSDAENTATVTGGGCDGQPSCTATDKDPINAAPVPVPAQVTPVPTLAEWGLILLAGLMAGLTWLTRRRHMG